jgi:hypothetical protein
MRDLRCFATDLACDRNRGAFLREVERFVRRLGDRYICGSEVPVLDIGVPSPQDWDSMVRQSIEELNKNPVQCGAAQILLPGEQRAPDRFFSVVMSHFAVP